MRKAKKIIFIAVGLLAFGLGTVGIIIPILPTTPFYLVAAFCFARGSQRLNDWFISTRLYKKHLDSFVKERSMLLKTKVTILITMSLLLAIAFFVMSNIYGRIVILLVVIFHYYYFLFRIKTKKKADSE